MDQVLLASALAIGGAIQVEDGQITVELPYASLAIVSISPKSRVFYRVVDPAGRVVTGYPNMAKSLPLAASSEPQFSLVDFLDISLRVVSLGRFVAGPIEVGVAYPDRGEVARISIKDCGPGIPRELQSALQMRFSRGEVVVGYNLLGSYALGRKLRGAPIEIVVPEDYALVVSRVALLPKRAQHLELARRFLDYLLSNEGQTLLSNEALVPPITADMDKGEIITAVRQQVTGPVHPIALNPSLLVFLDDLKKERFIRTWKALLLPRADRQP